MHPSKFVKIASIPVAYNDAAKRLFHSRARLVLSSLAQALHLPKGSYEIRNNKGGIAVSGEIILHSDHFYVCIHQSACGIPLGFYWRTCKGRGDYVGGPNRHAGWNRLLDLEDLAKEMYRVEETERSAA